MKKKYFYSIAAAFCLISVDAYSKTSLDLKNALSEFNIKKDTLEKGLYGAMTNRVAAKDWMKAPNSYIFDSSLNSEGLYIPVKKHLRCGRGTNF